MIQIKSEVKNYGINFPSNVNEITVEQLTEATKGINLPKHYCLVALCFKTKLFDFVTMINSKRTANISVVPLLAKISDEDAQEVNVKVGQKLIIDRTNLERGVHINIPIMINSDNAQRYFASDPALTKAIVSKDKKLAINEYADQNIIVMEFKIIPVNDISASVDIDNKVIDPFIYRANVAQA